MGLPAQNKQRASHPFMRTLAQIEELPMSKKNTPGRRRRATVNRGDAGSSSTGESCDDPHRLAKSYLRSQRSASSASPTLRFWRGEWWRWNGRYYVGLPQTGLHAEVTTSVKQAFDFLADTVHKPTQKVKRGPGN